MVKPTVEKAPKKKKSTKSDEEVRKERSEKRREKRQSRSNASKRKERQKKRKIEGVVSGGGALKKGKNTKTHTIQGGVVVAAKEKELKQVFNRAAMELLNAKKRQASSKKTAPQPTPSSIFLSKAVSLVSPIGYFGDLPVHGPPGQFISVLDTLEILAKIERRAAPKKAKSDPQQKEEEPKPDEDKPSTGAVARAKKLLEERKTTLPIFDLLREQTAVKREEGLAKMLTLLKTKLEGRELPNDAKPSKMDKAMGQVPSYVLNRLIKGLSSSVGGARMGFTQALTAILAETSIPTDYYLSQIDNFLRVPKSDLSPEQKQAAWGVVFASLALISSRRPLERVHIMTLVEKLTESSRILAPVRELCAYLLSHLIDTSEPAIAAKAILPKVCERYFTAKPETWSAEAIYLYMKLYTAPKGAVPESLTAFTHSPANPETAAKFADALIEGRQSALVFYPKVHLVWDEWAQYIAKGSSRDKSKAAQTVEGRLRAMWSAVVVDKLSADDDKRYRALSDYLVPKVVDVIVKSSVAQLPDRALLLADLGRTHPGITTELLKRCSNTEAQSLTGRDPKEEAEGLIKQLFDLNSANIKEKLQMEGEQVQKRSKAADSDDESGSESDADMEDEGDADVPDVEDDAEDREGYNRFAFNMRKVILAEMKKLAMTEGVLQGHPAVFQTIGQFFLTHAFFSVPDGAVDSDGLMSMETFPPVLRTECADHLYTLIKHYDVQASGTRTEAAGVRKTASSILASLVKHYQRLSADVGTQVLYEPTPESEKILKKIGKYVATGTGTCSKPTKGNVVLELHHKPHAEALLTLLYFTVVVEGGALTASEDILESISGAAADVGKIYTSGQYNAKGLLDTLLAFNLRSPSEAAAHLAAVANKVSLSIMEHMIADNLKTAADMEVLLSPLAEESFTVFDDGVDPEGGDEDEDGDEEEEEEEVPAAPTKADRVAIEKQLAHARMRSLQFLQTFLSRMKSVTPYVGLIAGPVARLAELSLPKISRSKEKHTGWGQREVSALQNASPVLSGCCAVLQMVARCPVVGVVKEWGKAYPTVCEEVHAAVVALSGIYCKDKEKMNEKEGKHLKHLLLRTVMTLIGVLHTLGGPSIEDAMVSVFNMRSLSSQFTETLMTLFERCPSAVGMCVLPALAKSLSTETGRPFHRKILFEIANTTASKWAYLEQLKTANSAAYDATIGHLIDCAAAFKASEGTGDDAWRARVVLPPAFQLHVTIAKHLVKVGHSSKAKFLKDGKELLEEYVKGARLIDVETRAVLRRSWEQFKPSLDYKEVVQVKRRKPEKEVKEAPEQSNDSDSKRKRAEATAEEEAAVQAAMVRKHAVKKRKVEVEKEIPEKKERKEKKEKKEKKQKE